MKRIFDVLIQVFTWPHAIVKLMSSVRGLREQNTKLQLSLGILQARLNQVHPPSSLQGYEFQTFSQWGEDGIIQFILHQLQLPKIRQTFIEFGVQDFLESNCRFLMLKDNWAGLVIDGSQAQIDRIKSHQEYWKFDLTAVCQFVTKENINQIFKENNFQGEVGILSMDIDGIVFWVWEAIDSVKPAVVVIEYNSHFGPLRDISVPYDPKFERAKKHYSGTYWGASIRALTRLANEKGYHLLGSNSNGINLFFVQSELAGKFKTLEISEAYVPGKFRDNRDASGQLLFGSFADRVRGIQGLPVWDFQKNQETTF